MGAQVTNWIYDDQDEVRYFNTNVNYQVAEDTLVDAYKHFSSTSFFAHHEYIVDNRYEEEGLIIRPITSQQGKTGIMCFNITHPDAKYRSNANGCYGEYRLLDLIDNVFCATGIAFTSEEIKNSYRMKVANRVRRSQQAAAFNRANTVITNSTGGYKTLAWCDKVVIDAILQAMVDEEMFKMHYEDLPDTIEANQALDVEPLMTLDEMLEYMVPEIMGSSIVNDYKENFPNFANWTLTPEEVRTYINAGFAQNGIDPDDYDYVMLYVDFDNPKGYSLQKPDSVEILCVVNSFTNDQIVNGNTAVNRIDFDPETQQGQSGWNYVYNSTVFMNNIPMVDGYYDRHAIHFYIKWDTSLEMNMIDTSWYTQTNGYQYTKGYNSSCGIYDYQQAYIKPQAAFSPKEWYARWRQTNYGFDGVYPAGIVKQQGAEEVPKNPVSLTVNSFTNWTGTKTMMGHLLGTMTYVPIGYGDLDNPSWNQARAQSGEIYSDQYQEKLGAIIENIDEFPTISEQITGDPDPPIVPDPTPTPTPTPDPTPASLANSNLFQVHSLSDTEVHNLGDFLFSNTFIEAIKNMFMEPLDAIIGCFMLYHGGTLPLGSNETLKLGSVTGATGVTGTKLTNQFQLLGCGAVNINEYYENVEDYAPYSSAEIFLPFIGYHTINVNEIMGGRVAVDYEIDCFTGTCVARIYVTRDGVKQELYNFIGNCAVQMPLAARDFTQGVQHLLGAGVALSTGNVIGAAYSLIGNISQIKRSGTVGSNAGAMAGMKPFILIKRPVAYNALNYPTFYGKPSNWTVTLRDCSGYTRIKDIRMDYIRSQLHTIG